MTLAVMGCIVNGPGESKAANIGIILPGTGEAPRLALSTLTVKRCYDACEGKLRRAGVAFKKLLDDYVSAKYPRKTAEVASR